MQENTEFNPRTVSTVGLFMWIDSESRDRNWLMVISIVIVSNSFYFFPLVETLLWQNIYLM